MSRKLFQSQNRQDGDKVDGSAPEKTSGEASAETASTSATSPDSMLELGRYRVEAPAGRATPDHDPETSWAALEKFTLGARQSDRARLISHDRKNAAHISFDMLRTRTLQAFREKGWRRLAVTSPTEGCGKTFVAANLALSFARSRTARVALVDLDLRVPSVAEVFGDPDPGEIAEFLEGAVPVEGHFKRIGERLAVGMNAVALPDPAETIDDPATAAALDQVEARLAPGMMIFDTPPVLACDDLLAMTPLIDCVVMVAGGGITRDRELVRAAELLEDRTPLLGIVLNRAEDPDPGRYYYR